MHKIEVKENEIHFGETVDIGYVVFLSHAGIIDYSAFKLLTADEARARARKIVKSYWTNDRYANPKHKNYDSSCAEAMKEFYEELYERAKNLLDCSLNDEDDIIITPIEADKIILTQ